LTYHKSSDDNFDHRYLTKQFTEHCNLESILRGMSSFCCSTAGYRPVPDSEATTPLL